MNIPMKNHSKNPGIKSLAPGQSFTGFCVLRKKEIKYKQGGEPYLVLELGDHSGRLKARIWEKPLEYARAYEVGNVVKIKALVQAFQDDRELKIQKIRLAAREDGVDLYELLPHTAKDVNELKRQFDTHLQSIRDAHLAKLLTLLFEDRDFKEAYCMSPAGKLWHHNYLSGMLEHVVAMLDMAEVMTNHYPSLNLDLLKTGIICHGVGKVREYSLEGFIDFSDQGRLLGYIAPGFEMISRRIGECENFPPELKDQLLHLILSHQADAEASAPIPPMTLEAVVLQHLILLDANANALCRILENDALPGARWTKFIPLLQRFVYVNKEPQQDKRQDDQAEV